MSAYVVNTEMIHMLVQSAENYAGAFDRFLLDGERVDIRYNQDHTGQMLLDAVYAGVSAAYGEQQQAPEYQFDRPRYAYWPPVDVLKALDGFEYQCADADTWTTSTAKAFCDQLRRTVIRYLPGYDDADWEITPDSVPTDLR